MSLALILALQAGAAVAPVVPSGFDLAALLRHELDLFDLDGRRACADAAASDSGSITVCGRAPANAYPMARMDRIYGPPPPLVAETGVAGNLRANVHVEGVPMPQGQVSNRVMVGLRLPF